MPHVSKHPANRPIWFDLSTTDAEAARAFYDALFGWQYRIGGEDVGFYATAHLADAPTAGIGQKMPGDPSPAAWTVYFGTDDAEAQLTRITAAGGSVVLPTMDIAQYGRLAVATDPTGAVFGLWEPNQHTGAGVVGEHGAMVWSEVMTRDVARALTFYTSVFALASERADMEGAEYHLLMQDGEPVAGLMPMIGDEWDGMPPHWMAYFQVDALDAALDRVTANGGERKVEPFATPYGRMAVIADPHGAVLSLIEPPAE